MPFRVKEFPGQLFSTFEEYEEARRKRAAVEKELSERAGTDRVALVTARVLPAPSDSVTRKVAELEARLEELTSRLKEGSPHREPSPPQTNLEGIPIGTVLQGYTRGRRYTLEVLDKGYLCSDGEIYPSLSAAALGVSGNRRSGWRFWKNIEGDPIGTVTGRFAKEHA